MEGKPVPRMGRLVPLESVRSPEVEAAIQKRLAEVKRQPMSLARALGDRTDVTAKADEDRPLRRVA